MSENIGIVLVSHSADVAKSIAAMLEVLSDHSINIAHCGGNNEGGLGSDVDQVVSAIKAAWSDASH